MLTNNIKHRRICAPGIVQIGEPVGEAWSKMQQTHGRLSRHAAITIGCARRYVLVQTENASQTGYGIHSQNQWHLRGAWIGETYLDAVFDGSGDKCFRTVHAASFL